MNHIESQNHPFFPALVSSRKWKRDENDRICERNHTIRNGWNARPIYIDGWGGADRRPKKKQPRADRAKRKSAVNPRRLFYATHKKSHSPKHPQLFGRR